MNHLALRYETFTRSYLGESELESDKFFIELILR